MQVLQERDELITEGRKVSANRNYNKAEAHTSLSPSSNATHSNRFHLSPQIKKAISPPPYSHSSPWKGKETKLDNILFTIEENYYFRKNNNNNSPRPPKFRLQTQRTSYCPEADISESSKQRRVIFTETLINDRPPVPRKQALSPRSIIRNGSFSKYNQDNLSSSTISAKSISVQNSFVSQLKTSIIKAKDKPRIDSNKQKYSRIMSYFRGNEALKVHKERAKKVNRLRQQEQQKYTDIIFPPVYSSLFLLSKEKHSIANIQWKRISDLFATCNPVVLSGESPSIITSNFGENTQFIAIAFNAIKHCQCILDKIFEEQAYNQYGLYLVKIFQHHNWKSIILDDFIPTTNKGSHGRLEAAPYLINVKPQPQSIEIWPFLLLKAYAYYYSAYELMTFGNLYDFLNELTGLVPIQVIRKKKSEKEWAKLKTKLQTKDSFAIAQIAQSRRQLIIRGTQKQDSFSLVYCEFPSFQESELSLQVFRGIQKYYLYNPRVFHSLSIATIGRYHPGHKFQERAEMSLRKLIVEENCECMISIQQKQSRFFCKSSLKYSYMWVRAILVQRQYNGYRWIDGSYTNNKSTVLHATLTQGEYYLIIMPEWKKTNNHELNLLVWANHVITIEREKANSCEQMIQDACMDLAQRKGTISQLKPALCSYNYICARTGLIIENINNEKLKEEVSVYRKISGIPCSVELLPINKQFWESKDNFKGEIEKTIPKLSAFTIVLKMRGGIDNKLVQLFKQDKQS